MNKESILTLAASLSLLSAASANIITFDGALPSGTTLFGGTSGEVTITYAGPDTGIFAGDITSIAVFPNDPTAPYFSVDSLGIATFAYAHDQNYLSLDWGTQDDYNRIRLKLGGADVATIMGSGNGTTASFYSTSSYVFDTIIFDNLPQINSFEIDNVTTNAVPDGGTTVAMCGLGLAILGLAKRKIA